MVNVGDDGDVANRRVQKLHLSIKEWQEEDRTAVPAWESLSGYRLQASHCSELRWPRLGNPGLKEPFLGHDIVSSGFQQARQFCISRKKYKIASHAFSLVDVRL